GCGGPPPTTTYPPSPDSPPPFSRAPYHFLDPHAARRRRDPLHHLAHDLFRPDPFRLRGEVGQHTVTQHRPRYPPDILRRHRHAPRQERVRLGPENERLPRSRPGPPARVLAHQFG